MVIKSTFVKHKVTKLTFGEPYGNLIYLDEPMVIKSIFVKHMVTKLIFGEPYGNQINLCLTYGN